MTNTLISKLTALALSATLLLSCGGNPPNLQNDNEVKQYLSNNKLFMQGDMTFGTDGTFTLIPQSMNDQTKRYSGTYSLGEFDGSKREINLQFSNYGDITDGHEFNGTNFKGVGRRLHGWLMATQGNMKILGDIVFDDNNPAGWVVGESGESEINTNTTERYNLEPK